MEGGEHNFVKVESLRMRGRSKSSPKTSVISRVFLDGPWLLGDEVRRPKR